LKHLVVLIVLALAVNARAEAAGCPSLAELKSDVTPPELYAAMRTCVAAGEFARAADLYALAGAETAFDTARVTDPAARELHVALSKRELARLGEAERSALMAQLRASLTDSARLPGKCAEIRKVGPPTYEPSYLLGKPVQIPAGFDPVATWKSALAAYLHCPDASLR